MHWTTKYTRKSHTKVANPAPGYQYEIVAREFDKPLKVYETTPTQRRHVIASLPAVPGNAAVLVAERAWEMALREQHEIDDWKQAVVDRNNGPSVSFLVTVPEEQAVTVQETLDGLYGVVLNIRMAQQPDETIATTAILPRPSLWKAIRAVNQDLESRDEQPLMAELPILGGPLNGKQALTLTLFLQTHYRWQGEDQEPEALWAARDDIWTDIAHANQKLMAPRSS